jgi:phospholipid/cholesterol/gamma-HCH transport system substrate-binding protein
MKKISNEVKVGTVALLTIVIFIWLYNFLKGKDFLTSSANYYTIYNKTGGLAESSPVEINGHKVGVVKSIDFVDATTGKLIVVFSVEKDFKLPRNTVAEIVPVSLLGGMKVQFVYGNGPGFYSQGDTIPGRLAESLMDKVESELLPVKDKVTNLVVALDSLIISINSIIDADLKENLGKTIYNLNGTTASLNNILKAKEEELKSTLENVNKFTKMLSDNSENMGGTFNNLKAITDTLAAADIYTTVSNLKSSLEKATVLMNKLNSGKGTAGQLLTSDSLYLNLNKSIESLNLLFQDMKANPKRYVHFSLFGKKSSPAK